MDTQAGLRWTTGGLHPIPRWTIEPDISKIELLARKHLRVEKAARCNVTFYAQGAFNKIYKVETENRNTLIRVALPIDPIHKTNSEVATILFVHQNTGIPVPQIFAFDDTRDNEIGFEWILMELLPGTTLRRAWRKISADAKRDLVKQVARYQVELFRHKFSAIGNLFVPRSTATADTPQATEENQQKQTAPILGQLVSPNFFWGEYTNRDISRGPFYNTGDWFRASLTLVIHEQERVMKTTEDDIEQARDILDVAKRLFELVPRLFPSDSNLSLETAICHNDLTDDNILVDSKGNITGVIDWECVSALPLWKTCSLPEFFEETNRVERPSKADYGSDNDVESEARDDQALEDALDNEGVSSLYWEHLKEYELTQLREIFYKEIGLLEPRWKEEFEMGRAKADFEEAVRSSDYTWRTSRIKDWLDAIEKGESWSLIKTFVE